MRVLHLYSDWRWTGPAEPTVNLCKALAAENVEATLACRRPVEGYPQSISSRAAERGVSPITRFHLNRYLDPRETFGDLRDLGPFLRQEGFQIIHCHLSHDHFLGGWASRCGRPRIPVVRTNHKAIPLRPTVGNRWMLSRWTDGLVEFSRAARDADGASYAIGPERMLRVEGAIDLERFDPARVREDLRPRLGVQEGEILVGIVARMQRHRRFELLLQAMALLKDRKDLPPIKLMVVGRGTYRQQVAVEPARRMGLQDIVLFPGYRTDDYLEHLGAMDAKVFLVPGSDGTCRAVREVMALGKPVVASRVGILPELVEDGRTGLLVDETPQALAEALARLARETGLRKEMGEAARRKAKETFSIRAQASRVAAFYREILRLGPRG